MSDELHNVAPEGGAGDASAASAPGGDRAPDSGASPSPPSKWQKAADTKKRKKELKEERQRRAAERRAAQASTGGSSDQADGEPSTGDDAVDEAWSKWVKEEMERPCETPLELAQLLGRLQLGLHAATQGSPYAEAVLALQWTNGVKPTPQCLTGCRMMWPFFKKHDVFVMLAEQAEAVLAALGLFVLVAPALGPAWRIYQEQKGKQSPPAAEQTLQVVPKADEQKGAA